MKKLNISLLVGAMLLANSAASALPTITVLAIECMVAGGGDSATQSQYTAGKVNIDALINAVPEIKKIAHLNGEQIVNIGLQDMNDQVWLTLAKKINADCDKTAGFIIIHGTDMLEETAYFLDLTTHCHKPIVMVGVRCAMKLATALGADEPLNIYNAVIVATDKEAGKRGVLLAMDDKVISVRNVVKMNTNFVEAFEAVNVGAEAFIYNGKVHYLNVAQPRAQNAIFDISQLDKLPKVGIVYNYSNTSALQAKSLIYHGYQDIVSAGVGNGNMYNKIFNVLADVVKQGIGGVRASCVPTGFTTLDAEVDDSKYRFVAAERLNPQKARVLLQLALIQTHDPIKIKAMFDKY